MIYLFDHTMSPPLRNASVHTSSAATFLVTKEDKSLALNGPPELSTKVKGIQDPIDANDPCLGEIFATGVGGMKYDSVPMAKVEPAGETCAYATCRPANASASRGVMRNCMVVRQPSPSRHVEPLYARVVR